MLTNSKVHEKETRKKTKQKKTPPTKNKLGQVTKFDGNNTQLDQKI